MCLQCDAKARVVKRDILPGGYILMRSTRDVEGWPKGWYGLVRSNTHQEVCPS